MPQDLEKGGGAGPLPRVTPAPHRMGSLPNKEERQDLKERIMESASDDYFDLQARCVNKLGPAAGIFVRQLLFWEGKGHNAVGWIYKTEEEMESETGLRRRGQREARKVLRSVGVLEEARRGLPRRLHYLVDLERLAEVLETPGSTLNQRKVGMRRDPESGGLYLPEAETLNSSYSQDGIIDPTSEVASSVLASEVGTSDRTSKDGITVPPSKVGNTDPAITESTSENTAENTQEKTNREPLLQEARIGQNGRSAPGPQEQEQEQGVELEKAEKTTRATPSEMNGIFRMLADESYPTCGVYRSYEKGKLSDQDLLESISYELTGSFEDVERFRWSVEECVKLLKEDEGIA